MNNYKYNLEKYNGRNTRYTCPSCLKPNEFTRYIDSNSGEIIHETVGKCNRESQCGYHYTPKQFFSDNGIFQTIKHQEPKNMELVKPDYIDWKYLTDSLTPDKFLENNLIQYLYILFGENKTRNLIDKYKIGTSNVYGGKTTIFWQIDYNGNIRTGKLIKYDKIGHRIKKLNNWVHSILNLDSFQLEQCFYGEHLLKHDNTSNVGIVESEKTAIILTAKLPEIIWLASGGYGGFNDKKVEILTNRNVTLYPDASVDGKIYKKWKKIATRHGFEISDFLEFNTTMEQKQKGVDIADFIVPQLGEEEFPESGYSISCNNTMENVANDENKNQFTSSETFGIRIPYNTPSPPAIIDSKIKNARSFSGNDLALKRKSFRTANNDFIECIELIDYGHCNNWENHKKAKGYCPACVLNQLHIIKRNGVIQSRGYSHLEILIMASKGQNNL